MWKLLPEPEATRAFMKAQIQREGLRAFLIAHYAHYDSISLKALAERFELPEAEAHADPSPSPCPSPNASPALAPNLSLSINLSLTPSLTLSLTLALTPSPRRTRS